MAKERPYAYAYGVKTILKEEIKKSEMFTKLNECATCAANEGYGFVMGYYLNGEKKIIGWNIEVVSREEAEEKFIFDGDKRTILSAHPKVGVWIIAPVAGYSPLLIPFEKELRSLTVTRLTDLVKED
ncbi:MAG: hypothetical protein E7020_02130 [Alphaproteobacteria bacterium]|nr:hypothetical protein [Alphaproteobacteria bacterium]